MMNISSTNIDNIIQLCRDYKVKSFSAFGSVTREDYNKDSDIDFIVDFNETDPIEYANLYFQLKEKLEHLLKRQIDLIEDRAIKNPYFKKELNNTKILIYGK